MKKFIKTYPVLFGVLISLVIFAFIILFQPIEDRHPGIDIFLGQHKRLIQGFLFSAGAFAAWVGCSWGFRKRHGYWPSILLFFAIHIAGLVLYSRKVHPLLGWQWEYVLILESYLLALFLYVGTHSRSIFKKLGKRSTRTNDGDERFEIGNFK